MELLLAASGADAGARAIGADADVGFAWSGRRRWCRRRSSAASYRVIDNDRKFRSTDSGGALPRSLSAAELRLGKISGIWQRLPCSLPSRARIIGNKATANQPPWLELFYKKSDSNERLRVSDWIVQRLV